MTEGWHPVKTSEHKNVQANGVEECKGSSISEKRRKVVLYHITVFNIAISALPTVSAALNYKYRRFLMSQAWLSKGLENILVTK